MNANAQKTECPSGHRLAGDNVLLTPQGWRRCRQCRRACNVEAKQRARQLAAARVPVPIVSSETPAQRPHGRVDQPAVGTDTEPYRALVGAILAQAVRDAQGAGEPYRTQAHAWLADEAAVSALLEVAGYTPEPILARLRRLVAPAMERTV